MELLKAIAFLLLGLACILGLWLPLFTGCTQAQAATVTMTRTWTAPGDDDTVGTAALYDLRFTTDTTLPFQCWPEVESCWSEIDGEPIPDTAGSIQRMTFTVDLLSGVDYYFAIKAADEVGNWSDRSNLVLVNIPDTVPPNTIVNLH